MTMQSQTSHCWFFNDPASIVWFYFLDSQYLQENNLDLEMVSQPIKPCTISWMKSFMSLMKECMLVGYFVTLKTNLLCES